MNRLLPPQLQTNAWRLAWHCAPRRVRGAEPGLGDHAEDCAGEQTGALLNMTMDMCALVRAQFFQLH